ncbi:hypothetical protein Tco_0729474 [Tanacetum coccineum]|uniref:Uncharacterized protein n=1 Tax=Tanacetum coccineum TaxID=301880 RepID=A0ABQ4YS38_9ASTR
MKGVFRNFQLECVFSFGFIVGLLFAIFLIDMQNKDDLFKLILGKPPEQGLFLQIIDAYPKFKWFKRRCHNHDLFLEALDSKQIGEDFIMSSTEIVLSPNTKGGLFGPWHLKTDVDGEFGKLDPQFWLGSCWLAQAMADIPLAVPMVLENAPRL